MLLTANICCKIFNMTSQRLFANEQVEGDLAVAFASVFFKFGSLPSADPIFTISIADYIILGGLFLTPLLA